MITALDSFPAIAEWLEDNHRPLWDSPPENVRFENMALLEDLDELISHHASGFKGRAPIGQVFDDQKVYRGFYGTLVMDIMVRKGGDTTKSGEYHSPYEADLFGDLPIHKINQSGLNSGRESVLYVAEELVSNEKPKQFIVEATQKMAFKVFLFADDFPNLWASEKMMAILKSPARAA